MPRRGRDRRESPEIWAPALLACEGTDDCYVLDALRRLMGIGDDVIQIEPFGPGGEESGIDRLPEYLAALPLREGFRSLRALGIVRDADTSAVDSFKSVTGLLAGSNFTAPDAHGVLQNRSHTLLSDLSLGVHHA